MQHTVEIKTTVTIDCDSERDAIEKARDDFSDGFIQVGQFSFVIVHLPQPEDYKESALPKTLTKELPK